jgi:hypothetical protein
VYSNSALLAQLANSSSSTFLSPFPAPVSTPRTLHGQTFLAQLSSTMRSLPWQPLSALKIEPRQSSVKRITPTTLRNPKHIRQASALFETLRTHGIEQVQKILSEQPEIVHAFNSEHGGSALHVAASIPGSEGTRLVRALIDAGAHVNAQAYNGSTPLHWCVSSIQIFIC